MGSWFHRTAHEATAILTDDIDTTAGISFPNWCTMRLYFPTGYSSVIGTIYDYDPSTNTYLLATDHNGNTLTITIAAGKSVNLPDEIFASKAIKVVTDADDSAYTVGVIAKS